jgi:hypothetical protein
MARKLLAGLLIAFLGLIVPSFAEVPPRLYLVNQGKPQASIILPASSAAPLPFAVKELQKYVEQMTSCRLEIRENPAGEGSIPIFLWDTTSPDQALDGVLGTSPKPIAGTDSYLIKATEGALLIAGGCGRAVLFGVYDLLERLGCRWLGPGEDFLPKRETLEVSSLEISESPIMQWRALELIAGITPSMVDWMAKVRLNGVWPESYTPNADLTANTAAMKSCAIPEITERGLLVMWGGHVLPQLFPESKYGKDRPEYFALIHARRLDPNVEVSARWQLCTSNPEVTTILCENVIQFLRNHPWIEVLFLWGNDTTEWCECEACRALEPDPDKASPFGGLDRSASYCRMIRFVSDAVHKALPDRKIAFNHYYNLENLPVDQEGRILTSVLPEDRVISAFDDYHQCDRHPYSDPGCPRGKRIEPIARVWSPHYRDSVSWTYYFAWNFMMGLPVSMVHKIPEDFRFIRNLGANGVVDNVSLQPDSLYSYNNRLNFYTYARASWNPDLDVETLQKDFIHHYYGAAAEPMEQFWRLMEDSWTRFGLDPAFMPEDVRLADPTLLHGRILDAMNVVTPEAASGSIDPRFLIPNRKVYEEAAGFLLEAEQSAGDAQPYRFRIGILKALIETWLPDPNPRCRVRGFLNGGGSLSEYLYTGGDEIQCSVAGGGGGKGDCFWPNPLRASLEQAGSSVEVEVKINLGIEAIGEPTYRSGPGLYQAQDTETPCGQEGAASAMFFIGNIDSETSGPRRVIVLISDGKFQTEILSSPDNAWSYGQYQTLHIDCLDASEGHYTCRYAYREGDQWREVGVHTFSRALPYAAPMHRWGGYDHGVHARFPLINWATLKF